MPFYISDEFRRSQAPTDLIARFGTRIEFTAPDGDRMARFIEQPSIERRANDSSSDRPSRRRGLINSEVELVVRGGFWRIGLMGPDGGVT